MNPRIEAFPIGFHRQGTIEAGPGSGTRRRRSSISSQQSSRWGEQDLATGPPPPLPRNPKATTSADAAQHWTRQVDDDGDGGNSQATWRQALGLLSGSVESHAAHSRPASPSPSRTSESDLSVHHRSQEDDDSSLDMDGACSWECLCSDSLHHAPGSSIEPLSASPVDASESATGYHSQPIGDAETSSGGALSGDDDGDRDLEFQRRYGPEVETIVSRLERGVARHTDFFLPDGVTVNPLLAPFVADQSEVGGHKRRQEEDNFWKWSVLLQRWIHEDRDAGVFLIYPKELLR